MTKYHQNHWTPVTRDNGASDYCLKEKTRKEGPWEFGLKPARRNVLGETKDRNAEIVKMGARAAVDAGYLKIEKMK